MKVVCFHCKAELPVLTKVGFRDECDKCRSDLHVCKNCHFYDPKAYNECREPSADVVKEKERANFCDYFTPNQNGSTIDDKAAQLKAAAEALFKKS